MTTLTASGIDRAMKCIASVLLPHGPDTTSEGQERGSALARYYELIPEVGAEKALAQIQEEHPDHYEVCASIDLSRIPTTLAAEVAWAYNPWTKEALELGRGIGRNYEEALLKIRPDADVEEWIFGTVDVLGVSEDAVFVGDHKGFQWVENPAANYQVGSGAMVLAKVYGKEKADVAILRPLAGSGPNQYAKLSKLDLDCIEDEILQLAKDIAQGMAAEMGGEEPKPKPGKHCQYCKAALNCSAAGALVKAQEALRPADPDAWRALVTRDNAAEMWAKAHALEALAKQVKGIVSNMAAVEPIPLGNGKTLMLYEKESNEKLDPTVVYRVLVKQLGERVANDAMARVATKKGVTDALKAHGMEKGRTALEKQIWEEVRRLGGARKTVKKEIGER